MAVDLSDLNPDFADRMNALIAAASAQGIKTNIISGARTPEDQRQLQANFLAGQKGQQLPYPERGAVPMAAAPGNSLHEYGLAADIEAADPNQQGSLRALAPKYGLNTIGPSDPNHFQMAGNPADLMKQYPMIGAGSTPNVNAFYSGSPQGTTLNSMPINFSLPANAPMGMRNNNPLNIKYYQGAPYAGVVGPSTNTDQGDPQMVFKDPQSGWNAAYSLLSRKYAGGMTTPNAIIAGKGGWTPGNTAAAANVAKAAGIGPDDDINFSDPAKAQKFMRALVIQEQGGAGSAYPDAMLAAAVGAPVSSTPGRASAGATGSPVSADATTAAGAIGTPSGPALPGFAPAQSNQFLQGASSLDKAMGGQGLQGQPGYGGGGQDQMRPSPMIGQAPAPHIPNAQAAAQTFGTTLNAIRTPLQWGSGTPGSSISATAGPQVAAGVPQGMTAQELQQIQQLQMMQMMGGGMGTTLSSPYGGGYG